MRTKEIVVCLLVLFVLALMVSNVYAYSGQNNTNWSSVENIPITNTNTTPVNNTNSNQNLINISVPNQTNNTINVISNVNTAKDLPDTGVDYSIVFIIAICGVSAMYAYKKIRDYNIK